MMKRIWCIICIVSLLFVSFGTLNVQAETGTDPEPVWLFPTDDAYINKNKPDNNYDYSPPTEGEIGLISVWGDNYHTYMKFDISNVDEINSASLHLYGEHSRSYGSDYIKIYEVYNTEWSETSISWNNAPVNNFTQTEHTDYKLIKEFNVNRAQGYYDYKIDIKDFLTEKVNEGKSFITLALCGKSSYFSFKIHSKDLVDIPGGNDGSTAPCLIINEDNTPPSAPQNLTTEAVSTEEIKLSWDASTDNIAVAGYEIYVNDQKVTVTSDVYAVVNGLQPSTWYTFYVKAFDTSQNVSEPSETVTAKTFPLPDDEAPSIPQNLVGKVLSPVRIKLIWDQSTDNIGVVGYKVYCNGAEIATTDSNAYQGYMVDGLSVGTSYTFSVKAFDIVGNLSDSSEPISVTTLSEPDAESPSKPSNLQISDLSTYSSQVELTWNASQDNIEVAGYVVYVNGSEKSRVSGTSYQLTNLAPYTQYSFYVKAFDEAGNISESSDTLNITTGCVEVRTVGSDQEYTTIQAAVDAANPGDVILVKAGNYFGNTTVPSIGTSDKWITIMAEDDNALIYGRIRLDGSYIRLAGFKMYGFEEDGTDRGAGAAVGCYGKNLQITDMHMNNFTFGVYTEKTSGNVYIADNTIYGCSYGIFSHADNCTFERNVIDYLTLNGRSVDDSDYIRIFGKNLVIRNNSFIGTVPGSHLGEAHVDYIQSYDSLKIETKNILIENNIMTGFCHQGIFFNNYYHGINDTYYLSDWTIRNNIMTGCTSWGICAGYPQANGGVSGAGVPNVIVENNIVGDPSSNPHITYYGIAFRGKGTTGIARNNIIVNTSVMSYGIITEAVITDAGNNLIYNGPKPGGPSTTDILGIDPQFVNPDEGDFHLQPTSIAIDMGCEVDFRYDFEGNTRPAGYGFDIGPYEFQGTKVNAAPIINIISPEEGALYDVGEDINVTVYSADDKAVTRVEYFLNDNKIGESVDKPFNYVIEDIQEGFHILYAVAYDEEGESTESGKVMIVAGESGSVMVASSWENVSIPEIQGTAVVSFEAIPTMDKMNGIMGVTLGAADAFGELAAIVRFNSDGLIDAWNGSPSYSHDNEVNYNAFEKYRFTMVIDIPQRLYSVFVTNEEGNTQVVAQNYPFRSTGAVGANKLDTIGCLAEVGSYLILCEDEGSVYVPVVSIDIEESMVNMQVGNISTLTAKVLPENATIKLVTWESSNASVATVDENGTVTAISEGVAFITARAAGTLLNDNCVVTVAAHGQNSPPVFVPVGEKSVNVGSTLEFTVSATDSDGDELTYSAEDLPDGANFDAETRTFNWNPTPQQAQENAYTVTFTVTDNENPPVQMTVNITVNAAMQDEYDFTINDVSIDKETGVAVEATITSNTVGGGNAVVIFKLMKNDGTVIGLTSSELYIEDDSVFKVKFHGYSGDEYKVKIFVWDELDDSTEDIGENLAEPVEIQ